MPVPPEFKPSATPPQSQPEVYCIFGAEPEVQAYAMAKYSRSALSMRESLAELNEQKAEKFLDTFYFQYGHRSIADLAHVAVAIERLSLLAATIVVDEPRWDGQERSTRYQDFRKSGYHIPDFKEEAARSLYLESTNSLFSEYRFFSEKMFEQLAARTPRPEEMKPEAYERTLRARAFDIARYLLPLATNTSLGQITNARTLESQVARLLSHTHPEVRGLGGLLKEAGRGAAWNVNAAAYEKLVAAVRARDAALGDEAQRLLLKPAKAAPTLVKYAEPNAYEMESRRELEQAAAELMRGRTPDPAPAVGLLEPEPLEIELATTLLYERSHFPYRQLRGAVESLSEQQRREIIALGTRHRGKHDELSRAFQVGQQFRFDILMDIGGFRDLHRHRRCTQVIQAYTFQHGYEMPEEYMAAGVAARYNAAMERAGADGHRLATMLVASGDEATAWQYLIPLAYRKRALFKMDLAEVVYIAELRTGVAGHHSYRSVAWQMYEAVARRYPALAGIFRVTDVREPVDLLQR